MKKVMVRAWEIAREAVNKFGGKVKEFFRMALIMAWKEVKGGVKMVELKGSEKQVKWAEDIRKNFVSALERYTAVVSEDERVNRVVDAFKSFKEEIENNESAKWFIENRNMVEDKKVLIDEKLETIFALDLDKFAKENELKAREMKLYSIALNK